MSNVSYRDFTGTGAENYERYFVPQIATPVSGALLTAADLTAGERVLDVACGTGVVAKLAAERVGPTGVVTGIDISPDMIDVAQAGAEGSGIEWHVGDATSLPFPDGSYDVVLCQMGLMFIELRTAAVAEMQRVLAPGGRVVVSTPGRISAPFELMEDALVKHIGPDLGGFVRAVFSMHDPKEVGALLEAGGFADVDASESEVTLRLAPPADFLWQYINLTPMGPFVAQAPESAREAMERQVIETWQPYVADGTTVCVQPMVIATGRRSD